VIVLDVFSRGLSTSYDVAPPIELFGSICSVPVSLLLDYLWNLLILVEALALLGRRSDFSRRRLLVYTLVATIGGAVIDWGHYALLYLIRRADWFAHPFLWSSLSMLLPIGLIGLWNLFLLSGGITQQSCVIPRTLGRRRERGATPRPPRGFAAQFPRSEFFGLPRREAAVVALLMGVLTAPWPILFLVTPWRAIVNLRQELGLGVLLLAAGLLPGVVHILRRGRHPWKRFGSGVGWMALAVVGLALVVPEHLDRLPAGLEGRIVYTVDGQIYVLDLRSGGRRWLAEGVNPMWSPDGESIAFARPLESAGKYMLGEGIYVLAVQGGHPWLLLTGWTPWWEPNARGKPGPHCPTWSRDEQWVVVMASRRKGLCPPPEWEQGLERCVQREWTSPLAVRVVGQSPPVVVSAEEIPRLDLRATIVSSDGRYRVYSAEGYLWLESLRDGKRYRIARGKDPVWWHPAWRE